MAGKKEKPRPSRRKRSKSAAVAGRKDLIQPAALKVRKRTAAAGKKAKGAAPLGKKGKFIDRELSWLEFNQRVMNEARDLSIPLLERLKFLAITASNLDEFYMVRVGGLQLLLGGQDRSQKSLPGTTYSEVVSSKQLERIRQRAQQMAGDQYATFLPIEARLAEAGIHRLRMDQLTPENVRYIERFFEREVFPLLTPVSIEEGEEIPLLTGLTLHLCVRLSAEGRAGMDPQERYVIVIWPRSLSRFVSLPATEAYSYILLEDVIASFLFRLFPGEQVTEAVPFRLTRNADLELREDLAADLLAEMQELLVARRESGTVRLEIRDSASGLLLEFLQGRLGVGERDTVHIPGPLDLSSFIGLTQLGGFDDLRYDPWPPQPSPLVDPQQSLFSTLAERNVLLFHPYESFDPVLRFVEEAADDPNVLAIKQILYRTSTNSPIVSALVRAAVNGKQVTAVIELKARFDEARNIDWARALERAGVQVIYGLKRLKTHAKLCIVVRREVEGIRRYVHFSTGNYNEITAKLYSDISYLTSNEDFGADAAAFFNMITGSSQPGSFRLLEAAPIGLRERLMDLIASETERAQQGQKAQIMAKVNSLVDPDIIKALYKASQAGVKVLLNVRGICCLRPGIAKLSENIRVTSIVDRYLEHSRIFYFAQGGQPLVFISSADWMPRNLDRRVELLIPIIDVVSRNRLIGILGIFFLDTVKARRLLANGSYERALPAKKRKPLRAQEFFYEQAILVAEKAASAQLRRFEPYYAPSAER